MFQVSDDIRSKYRFVNLCAQRTRQLMEGAEQRVETTVTKPAYIAMREILDEEVKWLPVEEGAAAQEQGAESVELETT